MNEEEKKGKDIRFTRTRSFDSIKALINTDSLFSSSPSTQLLLVVHFDSREKKEKEKERGIETGKKRRKNKERKNGDRYERGLEREKGKQETKKTKQKQIEIRLFVKKGNKPKGNALFHLLSIKKQNKKHTSLS